MTTMQALITALVVMLTTIFTRALAFLLFPAARKTPPFVVYLGQVLPYAVIGMLVVYCFKGIQMTAYPFALPEFIAGTFVVLMHKWRHNMLLSIGGGTVLYMVLVQLIFVG